MFRFIGFLLLVLLGTGLVLWMANLLPGANPEETVPDDDPSKGPGKKITLQADGGVSLDKVVHPPPLPSPSARSFDDPISIPNASVALKKRQDISFRVDGKVGQIYVSYGTRVRKGQLLAKLDEELIAMQVDVAETKAKDESSVNGARLAYDAASETVANDSKLAVGVAEEQRKINLLRKLKALEDWRGAQSQQLVAKMEFEQKRHELHLHRVYSEVSGVVTLVTRKQGESLRAGETLIHIDNLDHLEIEGGLEMQQGRRVKAGMRVLVEPEIRVGSNRELREHTGTVTSLALTPDGRFLISGSDDQTVRFWDWRTRTTPTVVLHDDAPQREIYAVACSPIMEDSREQERTYLILAAGAGGKARLWSVKIDAKGRCVKNQVKELGDNRDGHKGAIRSVAFSPDGRWCATGGEDRHILVYDVDSAKFRYRIRATDDPRATAHRGAVTALHFTADADRFAHLVSSSTTDKTLKKWKLDTDKAALIWEKGGRTGDVAQLGVSADGQRALFEVDQELRILDLNEGSTLGLFHNPQQGHFSALALFSPSGKSVLTVSAGGRLQLLAVPATPEQRQFFREGYEKGFRANAPVVFGAFSNVIAPTGLLALPAQVGLSTYRPKPAPADTGTTAFDVVRMIWTDDPEESQHELPQLWPLYGYELLHLGTPDASAVTCGAFSADEKFLFTAGADKVIRIWRTPEDQEQTRPLEAVVTYVADKVDSITGLVQIRAELQNPQDPARRLKPGDRVNLTVYPEAVAEK